MSGHTRVPGPDWRIIVWYPVAPMRLGKFPLPGGPERLGRLAEPRSRAAEVESWTPRGPGPPMFREVRRGVLDHHPGLSSSCIVTVGLIVLAMRYQRAISACVKGCCRPIKRATGFDEEGMFRFDV